MKPSLLASQHHGEPPRRAMSSSPLPFSTVPHLKLGARSRVLGTRNGFAKGMAEGGIDLLAAS